MIFQEAEDQRFFLFLSVELSEFLSPDLEPQFCCLYFGCQKIPTKHHKPMETIPFIEDIPFGSY
jgi:hypothetical protein